uniref:Transmembrane protein 220 n=2 Tax=Macrostomum lignano TaxID=282301 RepID=A0A1I8IGW3_9PLAT
MIRRHSSSSSSGAPDSRLISMHSSQPQQQQGHDVPSQPLGSAGGRFWIWRCANVLASCLFFMCAAVQTNDPDPVVWIPIYALPCLLALALALKPSLLTNNATRWLMLAHSAICLSGLAYLLQSALLPTSLHGNQHQQSLLARNPLAHEEGREAAGLLLVSVWLAAQLCLARFGSACGPAGMLALLAALSLLALLPAALWSACLAYDPTDPGAPAHCADMAAGPIRRGEF